MIWPRTPRAAAAATAHGSPARQPPQQSAVPAHAGRRVPPDAADARPRPAAPPRGAPATAEACPGLPRRKAPAAAPSPPHAGPTRHRAADLRALCGTALGSRDTRPKPSRPRSGALGPARAAGTAASRSCGVGEAGVHNPGPGRGLEAQLGQPRPAPPSLGSGSCGDGVWESAGGEGGKQDPRASARTGPASQTSEGLFILILTILRRAVLLGNCVEGSLWRMHQAFRHLHQRNV